MEALQTGSPSRWPEWTSRQPVPTEAPNRISQSSSFLLPEPKSLQCPLGTITTYTETATSPFSGVPGDFALIPESLHDHGHAYAKSSKQTARPYVFPEQDLLVFFQAFLILKVVQMVVCLVLLVTVKWHLSSPWAEHAMKKQ